MDNSDNVQDMVDTIHRMDTRQRSNFLKGSSTLTTIVSRISGHGNTGASGRRGSEELVGGSPTSTDAKTAELDV